MPGTAAGGWAGDIQGLSGHTWWCLGKLMGPEIELESVLQGKCSDLAAPAPVLKYKRSSGVFLG